MDVTIKANSRVFEVAKGGSRNMCEAMWELMRPEIEAKINEEISDKIAKIEDMNAEIADKDALITDMREEIAELRRKLKLAML